jgi:hypothetical protein
MTRAKWILLLAGLIALLSVSFVTIRLWPTSPHGGLSEADAIEVARTHADVGAVGVLSADVRHNFDTGHNLRVHSWAWVVTFSGQWHLLCDGGADGCNPTSEWVAIDYYTGEWIASQHSYLVRR